MIKSFKHKGLKALHNKGDASGVRAEHVARLRRLLLLLDVAAAPDDLDRPGYRLHTLKGELKGYWAMDVSGNWRIIFRFIGSDIELVNYLDYH